MPSWSRPCSSPEPAAAAGDTDRSHEIAAHWDVVERDLRAPEVWAFATGKAAQEPTHISLLLDTLADMDSDEGPGASGRCSTPSRPSVRRSRTRLRTCGTGSSTCTRWCSAGTTTATSSTRSATWSPPAGTPSASWSSSRMDRRRAASKGRSTSASAATSTSRQPASAISPTRPKKTPSVLLLMNVETVRRMQHSSERYSFSAYASGSWSLEHIHAQNAERLNRAEQWEEWLRLHRDALDGLPDLDAGEAGRRSSERIDDGAGRHLGGELPAARTRTDGAASHRPATPTTTTSTRSPTSRCSTAATTARSATPCSRSSAARSCASTARVLHPGLHAQRVPQVLHRGRGPADPLLGSAGPRGLPRRPSRRFSAPYLLQEEVSS